MRFAIASLLLMTSAFPAAADSLWNHNGSIMHLQQDGDKRFMYYAQPRQGMIEAGVTPGTLFFDGVRQGDELIGTARVFSSKCPAPMTFSISGPIFSDGRIVLEGMRPVFKNCKATDEMKLDQLEFVFIENFIPEFTEEPAVTEEDPVGDGFAVTNNDSFGASASTPGIDIAETLKKAMSGDAKAYRELATAFATGDGVIRSEERSLFFLRKAAELGDNTAKAEWSAAIISSEKSSAEEIELAGQWIGSTGVDKAEFGTVDTAEVAPDAASEGEFWLVEMPSDVQGRFVEGMDCNNAINIVLDSKDSKGIYSVKMIEGGTSTLGLITSNSFCQLMQDCSNQVNLKSTVMSQFSGSRLGGTDKYLDSEGCLATSEFSPAEGILTSRTTYSDTCGERWKNVVNEGKWFACNP